MTTALGPRLAVLDALAYCDHGQHETRIVTDGTTAYAYTIGTASTDVPAVARNHTALGAPCPDLDPVTGDTCTGWLAWDLATDGWTTDTEALRLLATYGKAVE